jgi:hypothetical protein
MHVGSPKHVTWDVAFEAVTPMPKITIVSIPKTVCVE